MNKFEKLLILVLLCFSFCLSASERVPIDNEGIKDVGIYHHTNKNNIIYLSKENVKKFIEEWKNSMPVGPCKYIPDLWVVIEYQSGIKRTFRINSQTIKEDNDYCYKISASFSQWLYETTR